METNIKNPVLPFSGLIPSGIFSGRSISLTGSIPSNCQRFRVDLSCGTPEERDCSIALHISCRFDEKRIVRNSYFNGEWQDEDKDFFKTIKSLLQCLGKNFELIIRTEETHFMLAINGDHIVDYLHRLPISSIKTLSISGNLQIDEVNFYNNFAIQRPLVLFDPKNPPSPYNLNQSILWSPSDVIYNPSVPFTYTFSGGLTSSKVICLSGRPSLSSYRFTMNFVCLGSQNVPLHVNPRFDQRRIILNSLINDKWGREEEGKLFLNPGVNFDLVIKVTEEGFQFYFNGQDHISFDHRFKDFKLITALEISGDINLISIKTIEALN